MKPWSLKMGYLNYNAKSFLIGHGSSSKSKELNIQYHTLYRQKHEFNSASPYCHNENTKAALWDTKITKPLEDFSK